MSEQTMLSTRQVADRLGVSARTVQRWINAGHFPGSFPLNPNLKRVEFRIPLKAVEAFEAERSLASSSRELIE